MTLKDIGVVIPSFNEGLTLPHLFNQLKELGFESMIVVDAQSTDETIKIGKKFNVQTVVSKIKNRAVQMNLGATYLKTEFLLFLHADVQLDQIEVDEMLLHVNQANFSFANFRLAFDSRHWFLTLNSWFSYLKNQAFQFGDQGLLVRSSIFTKFGGYDEGLLFMEGNHIIRKLRKTNSFMKLESKLTVSSRKYREVGIYRLQFSYYLIYLMEQMGVGQRKITTWFPLIFK